MVSFNLMAAAALSFYVAKTKAANYDTYPSVAKTATINGFADPIYSGLPECAKSCVDQDTDVTPCPYWDTGCLCVMSNFGDSVADCIAESCKGNEVSVATSLAISQCSVAGVPSPYWYIGSDASAALSSAAEATVTGESSSIETSAPATSAAVETSAPAETSAHGEASASGSTPAPETTAPAQSSTPAQSSAPAESSSSAGISAGQSSSSAEASSTTTDIPEVEEQENAAAVNIPGQILIGLSAISFGALLF